MISSAADLPTDGVFNVTTEDATITVDVGIDDGGTPVAVVKRGAGRLVLNAANSFTGGLTVEEGYVIVNHADEHCDCSFTSDLPLNVSTAR